MLHLYWTYSKFEKHEFGKYVDRHLNNKFNDPKQFPLTIKDWDGTQDFSTSKTK